jgi:DNA-binding MarR family transcriptional regulator
MSPQLGQLLAVVRVVRDLNPRMEMQDLETLLLVAANPGCSPTDIEDKVGISNSAASRSAYRLSAEVVPGSPGLGLLTIEVDPKDRRRKQLYLTPVGQRFVTKLSNATDRRST